MRKTVLKPTYASRNLDELLFDDELYLVMDYKDKSSTHVYLEFDGVPPIPEGHKRKVKVLAKGYYDPYFSEYVKSEWTKVAAEEVADRSMRFNADGGLDVFRPLTLINPVHYGYEEPASMLTIEGSLRTQTTEGFPSLTTVPSGNVGIGTDNPQATLDINGYMRLKKSSTPPVACENINDGSLALTQHYTLCVCKEGIEWVNTSDGSTACIW